MQIKKWMQHPVQSIKPRDNIEHARSLMVDHHINQIPVVVDKELVGIVTDRDLRDAYPSVFDIARASGERDDGLAHPEKIEVESVMTSNVLSLESTDSVADAAALMKKERIGAVPIVDDGQLVGILARSDVLAAFISLCEKLPNATSS
jgi:acetoin utilization protein AcuB